MRPTNPYRGPETSQSPFPIYRCGYALALAVPRDEFRRIAEFHPPLSPLLNLAAVLSIPSCRRASCVGNEASETLSFFSPSSDCSLTRLWRAEPHRSAKPRGCPPPSSPQPKTKPWVSSQGAPHHSHALGMRFGALSCRGQELRRARPLSNGAPPWSSPSAGHFPPERVSAVDREIKRLD